jgi:hypothetical protein
MRALVTLLACVAITLSTSASEASRRAFIVGISNYDEQDLHLNSTLNDANAIAKQLSKFDFASVYQVPESKTSLGKFNIEWSNFLKTIKKGDDIVFYYSGHGVGLPGENYIVPKDFRKSFITIGADGQVTDEVKKHLISLEKLRADVRQHQAIVTIWILDACRDNPFELSQKGLSKYSDSPTANTLILYSAAAGEESNDSTSKGNSLYTQYFLAALSKIPDRDAFLLARSVEHSVFLDHGGQNPEITGVLGDWWCFNTCDPNQLIDVRIVTASLSQPVTAPSKAAFAKPKSIMSDRQQNAVFLGKQSDNINCSTSSNLPFGCAVLADVVNGNGSKYFNTPLVAERFVNIRKRPPIVKDRANYFCIVDRLSPSAAVAINGIITLQYRNDTYYWATTTTKKSDCLRL